jgi:hypothetical protein
LKGLWDSSGTKLDPREFCCGKSIDLHPKMTVHSNGGHLLDVHFPLHIRLRNQGVALDFTFASFDMPVVSGEVAHLLLSIDPNSVQIFPVAIEGMRNDYYIANITSRLACLDVKRSDLEWWTEADSRPDKVGKPKAIYELVIDPQLPSGHHLFRVEGWEIALIASDEVRKAFENAHVTGVNFHQV